MNVRKLTLFNFYLNCQFFYHSIHVHLQLVQCFIWLFLYLAEEIYLNGLLSNTFVENRFAEFLIALCYIEYFMEMSFTYSSVQNGGPLPKHHLYYSWLLSFLYCLFWETFFKKYETRKQDMFKHWWSEHNGRQFLHILTMY